MIKYKRKEPYYMKHNIIEAQNIKVNITNVNDSDYIHISDFAKFKVYNPNFNSIEFDGFRKNAGLHLV
jgi:hypothetical protein